MTAESVSRAWSWRKAVVSESGLMPTTRHVLLTLSLHMNEHGEGCFPPVEDLVAETGLSKRAVLEHLNKAIEAGWLTRHELGLRGRRWRRSEYQPAWPGREIESDMAEPGGDDGRSPPCSDEVVTQDHQGGDPNDNEVVTDDHHVRKESIQESSRSPVEREARAGAEKKTEPVERDDPRFVELMRRHPGIHDPGIAFGAFERLSEAERTQALERHDGYLAIQRAEGRKHHHALATYLGKKLFEQVPDPKAEAAQVRVTVEPRTKQWWGLFWRRFKRGDRVGFMLSQAADNHAWSAPLADLPSEAELSALVSIEKGSPEWEAWEATILRAGRLSLRGDSGKFIFVPSEWPAESAT